MKGNSFFSFGVTGKTIAVVVVWQQAEPVLLQRIFLGRSLKEAFSQAKEFFQELKAGESLQLKEMKNKLEIYLSGQPVSFSLDCLYLENSRFFQQSVYEKTACIPWGKLATYKEIACQTGKPFACQAVGQALARNPFPIVIPCHRVIKSNGQLGGFSAGLALKKDLLTIEGWGENPADSIIEYCKNRKGER